MTGSHPPSRLDGRSCPSLPLACAVLALSLAPPAPAEVVRVRVAGDAPKNGIFDPTLEYDPATGSGWLAYSAVFGDASPWGPHVETHLARSEDGGASWSFVAVVNASTPASVDVPGEGLVSGVWNYEVPSLVHDPGDAGAAWKLFAHRIFRRDPAEPGQDGNVPALSWIVLRTAPEPGGPWSPERALLRSGAFPPPPYAPGAIVIDDLDPSLSDLQVYSEPGSFERSGVLYLGLTGLTAAGPDRIVLLASDDHAASWRFVGTPLAKTDAAPLGYESFDGTAIVEEGGRVFLLATPESPGVLHDGTLAFEFASLTAGALVRAGGVPVIHLVVPAQPGLPLDRRGGQADYHASNVAGGLLQPALHVEDLPELFQFSSTGIRLVPPPTAPGLGAGPGMLACAVIGTVGSAALRRRHRMGKQRGRGRRPQPGG